MCSAHSRRRKGCPEGTTLNWSLSAAVGERNPRGGGRPPPRPVPQTGPSRRGSPGGRRPDDGAPANGGRRRGSCLFQRAPRPRGARRRPEPSPTSAPRAGRSPSTGGSAHRRRTHRAARRSALRADVRPRAQLPSAVTDRRPGPVMCLSVEWMRDGGAYGGSPQERSSRMLGIVAAVLFFISFLINAADIGTNDVFSSVNIMLLGLTALALHVAGVGAGMPRRR